MSVLTYKRYARLSLRKYRKSFGWPVVDNFLAIIYTCGPAWVIRITFSLIPVLVLTSDVSNESSLLPPLAFNYDSQVSLVREIWRRCLPSGKQRRDDSNFLDKSGSQIPGMRLFQSTLCVPRDLLTDFELTILRYLKFDILKEIYRAKKEKSYFTLNYWKHFFADKIRIIRILTITKENEGEEYSNSNN